MLAEEPDVRKALVRFREGLGGNLRGAPSLLDFAIPALRGDFDGSEETAKLSGDSADP
mgnify:CR=1 FL=1